VFEDSGVYQHGRAGLWHTRSAGVSFGPHLPVGEKWGRVCFRHHKAVRKFVGMEDPDPLTGEISLLPEPSNPSDPGAILVLRDGVKIGYVARRCLNPLHSLLSGYLSHIRAQHGFHPQELDFPLLVNLIGPDDRGAPYGSLQIVGLDEMSLPEGAPQPDFLAEPFDQVTTSCMWLLVMQLKDSSTSSCRTVTWRYPVSEAVVRRYAGSFTEFTMVSATPTPSKPL